MTRNYLYDLNPEGVIALGQARVLLREALAAINDLEAAERHISALEKIRAEQYRLRREFKI